MSPWAGQSKHHTGKCDFVFDKWTKSKCKICGQHRQWRMRCSYPICNRTFTMGHRCGSDNINMMYS